MFSKTVTKKEVRQTVYETQIGVLKRVNEFIAKNKLIVINIETIARTCSGNANYGNSAIPY